MNLGYWNELRRYNEARAAERRNAIVFKAACLIGVALLIGWLV